jgi:hypothetical protein
MKFAKVTAIAGFVLAVTAAGAMAQTAPATGQGASSAAAAPTCVAEKLSSDSLVGDLLDNPAAKAILIKHVPALKDNDQIDQARPMTLRSLQAYAADTFTDKVLADIDADLATIPVCAKK